MPPIPRTTFSTDQIPARDRFDIYRDSVSVIFDAEAHDKKNVPQFEAHLDSFMFGQIMLARHRTSAAKYIRSKKAIDTDGIDSILIQFYLKGGLSNRSGKLTTEAADGDVIIFDLSKPTSVFNPDFDNICALFPRDLMESYLPTISKWHGQVLPRDRPMTRLLRQHMLSLYQIGSQTTNENSGSIQRSLLEITSCAIQGSADTLPASSEALPTAILFEIKRWIRSNISHPDLSPNSLCSTFSLSRTQLYRITEPLGGISNYIRNQRLKRSFTDLQNPKLNHHSISEIGYKWGFSNQGSYTRSFKKYFGLVPRDVREMVNLNQFAQTNKPVENLDRNYEDWIRSIST